MEKRYLCLDVGGTSIKYAVCGEDGQFFSSGKVDIGKTLEAFLDQVQEIYEESAPVEGIAGSFPGEVHSEEGVIYGISANPWIIQEIDRTYRELVKGQQMEYLMPTIVACEKGNDANLLGALAYYFKYGAS